MTRLTVTLWTCGRCRKPRGLHHACTGTRGGRDQIRIGVTLRCPSCGALSGNPLTHTCRAQSDFRKRKAAEKRHRRAEERKRKKRAAAARKRARAKERKRLATERRKAAEAARRRQARNQTHDRNRHEYAACTDNSCERALCRAYRDGIDLGRLDGEAEGFAKGYADGMNACPLPHS